MRGWRIFEPWRFFSAASVLALVVLAVLREWPFDSPPLGPNDARTLAEVALGDRLTVGLIRTGVVALVGYVVVSVPALVLERRWLQGLTTTGLAADPERVEWQDEFRAALRDIRQASVTEHGGVESEDDDGSDEADD